MNRKSHKRYPGMHPVHPRHPLPTVDVIIELRRGIVLIQRKNEPFGWAIPGGFVEYGETVETAAVREAREETSLNITLKRILGVYSDPDRDPRFHTISVVFLAAAEGLPAAADDALEAAVFTEETCPTDLAFDHHKILADYFASRKRV